MVVPPDGRVRKSGSHDRSVTSDNDALGWASPAVSRQEAGIASSTWCVARIVPVMSTRVGSFGAAAKAAFGTNRCIVERGQLVTVDVALAARASHGWAKLAKDAPCAAHCRYQACYRQRVRIGVDARKRRVYAPTVWVSVKGVVVPGQQSPEEFFG